MHVHPHMSLLHLSALAALALHDEPQQCPSHSPEVNLDSVRLIPVCDIDDGNSHLRQLRYNYDLETRGDENDILSLP